MTGYAVGPDDVTEFTCCVALSSIVFCGFGIGVGKFFSGGVFCIRNTGFLIGVVGSGGGDYDSGLR